jgi:hypothetical protein
MHTEENAKDTCRNLVFVGPCIVSIDGKEENQLDAEITVY